jgi:hypothetical protein
MIPSGVTWTGPSIDDVEVLSGVPKELTALLLEANDFSSRGSSRPRSGIDSGVAFVA